YRKDILEYAYRCCRANRGAPGVDDQDFVDIEAYGVERWLGELADKLRGKTYRAEAVRRVWIPKADGKKLRPLGIPCIADRVVMTAAVSVMAPIFEVDMPAEQHAYRANFSAHTAVRSVHSLINTGHMQIIEGDLAGYFDSIPHAELMKSVARRVSDRHLLHLIKMWLDAPVEEEDGKGGKKRTTPNKDSGRGVPQGALITPLTQKVTFSLSEGFRGSERVRSLICDARSIILMSHGEIHAGAKGDHPERGISTSLAKNGHSRIGGSARARELDFTASSISLSRASRSTRTTDRGGGACAADHLQNSWQRYSCAADLRRGQQADIERGFDARHHGVRGARLSAWVSGVARPMFVSNMPSTVCSPPNSSASMRFSFPIGCG
ncbi:MAG: reverse transcriptase domain-containing protein, partial [Gemmatimonadales bacterium]